MRVYNVFMQIRKEQLIASRLVLKPIDKIDQEDMLKIVKDPLVKKSYMLPDFTNKNEEELFFQKLMNVSHNIERFVYGIYSKNKIIGFLNEVSKENDEIEIGYFIASNEWNKGYATEALKVAIEELFRIGYKHVLAAHFESNPASGRVMQKCGMERIDKEEILTYRNVEHRCIYYRISR